MTLKCYTTVRVASIYFETYPSTRDDLWHTGDVTVYRGPRRWRRGRSRCRGSWR